MNINYIKKEVIMNDIKITNEEKGLDENKFNINARDIFKMVESKRDFTDWINYQIESYSLIEGKDFSTKNVVNPKGTGRPLKEYFITPAIADLILLNSKAIPDAKEKQKEVVYFMHKVKDLAKNPLDLIEYCFSSIKELQYKNEVLTTNIKKLEGNDLDVLFYAKEVGAELGISAIKLNRFLEEQKVIYKQNGHWHLYVKYSKECILKEVKEKVKGSNLYVSILKITPKGRVFIKDLWSKING